MTFKDLGLPEDILEAIEKLGFEEPTTIQAKCIPSILKGLDVIGESATGSGKTLAFAAGIVYDTLPREGLQAIVLTPTRELAEQVKNSILEIATKKFKIIGVYGGVAIGPQIKDLETAEIVVATPGRLLDHLERGTIDLKNIRTFVLDEADRMLDMGFIDDVKKIMDQCPLNKQTLLFSATVQGRIGVLAEKYLHNPIKVSASKQVDPKKLTQCYYDVPNNQKLSLLIHLLNKETAKLVMVFCNTRRQTDFVEKNLKANGIEARAIHGGLTQNKRMNILEGFNNAKVTVLVCTDVAARGLHIDNVSHVYNYDIPSEAQDYVHRIGRTARAGEEGKAINLLSQRDHDNYNRVLREYGDLHIPLIPTPKTERAIVKQDDQRPRGRFGGQRGGPRRNAPRRQHARR